MKRTKSSNCVASRARRAILIAITVASPTLAVDKEWLTQNGTWSVATNWSPLGAPNGSHSVFIGNTAGAFNGNVYLGADADAANLSLSDGMELLTNNHAMTVSGNTTISGRNVTPAAVVYYSRVRIENGPSATDFRTNNLTVTNQARFFVDGGTARVDGLVDIQDDSYFDGNGVLNLYGNGAVVFRNNGRINPDPGGLTINQFGTGRVDLDGTVADNGLINITTATIDGTPFASLTINGTGLNDAYNERFWLAGGNALTMNLSEGWTLGTGGSIRFFSPTVGNDRSRVNGGTLTVQGTFDVDTNAYAEINAPAVLAAGSDIIIGEHGRIDFEGATTLNGVSVTMEQGGDLDFDGPTTVIGGTFSSFSGNWIDGETSFDGPTNWRGTVTLNGVARQNGDATVSLATVINGQNFDMDGLTPFANWTVNAPLQINTQFIDLTSNNFNGDITVNAANLLLPAYIEMNLPGDNAWSMNGTMTLNGPASGFIAQPLRGSDMTVGGTLTVNGDNSSLARVEVRDTGLLHGVININANSSLRLDGGSIADPNLLQGGRIAGAGVLRAGNNRSLVGNGTISANIDFSGTAELRAKDGFLRITGPISAVGVIGTADDTGILNVANAWNTSVADRVELLGGQVTGGAITNSGTITGHGTVFPLSLSNSGTIVAVGGDLHLNTVADNISLGGAGTGQVRAVEGNITVADVPFSFNGRAVVGAGRTLTMAAGWVVASTGTLELTGTPASPATIAGVGQTVNGTTIVNGLGQFDLATFFNSNSHVQTSAADDTLALLQSGFVGAGASFTGPGQLRNATADGLTLEDASTVGITLVNAASLSIDGNVATGIAAAQRFQQTGSGATVVQLAGAVPGTGYDRLDVATTAALSGRLQLGLLSDYDPAYLVPHEVLRADSISGFFQSVPGNQIAPNKWLAVTYDADSVLVSAALPGDANLDGAVNLDDFTAMAAGFGVAGTWSTGNFNGDGKVNLDDFTALAANFGVSLPADLPRGTAVPEPSMWWLTAPPVAAVLLGRGRRRRNSGKTL